MYRRKGVSLGLALGLFPPPPSPSFSFLLPSFLFFVFFFLALFDRSSGSGSRVGENGQILDTGIVCTLLERSVGWGGGQWVRGP